MKIVCSWDIAFHCTLQQKDVIYCRLEFVTSFIHVSRLTFCMSCIYLQLLSCDSNVNVVLVFFSVLVDIWMKNFGLVEIIQWKSNDHFRRHCKHK